MKKSLLFVAIVLLLCVTLSGCGSNQNTNNVSNENNNMQESKKADSISWPTNTVFPKPEGCKIIEVRQDSYKNYITVEWESKEAAKTYIEKVKEVEGDKAEVIGQGETDDSIYYGTYQITITSMNEKENIVLYN